MWNLSFSTGVEAAEKHTGQVKAATWSLGANPSGPSSSLQQLSITGSGRCSRLHQQRSPEQRVRGLGGGAGCTRLSAPVHRCPHAWVVSTHARVCLRLCVSLWVGLE